MLVLATFFTIGTVAVLFLLRFLFALNSEATAERNHAAGVQRFISHQSHVGEPARVLTMVDSKQFAPSLSISSRTKTTSSQYKQA